MRMSTTTIGAVIILAFLLAAAVANRPPEVLQENEIGTVYVPDGNRTGDQSIKYALYEVYDFGRFLLDKKVFARVQIAQFWVRSVRDKTWRTVDLRAPGACGPEKTNAAGTQFMKCSAASVNMPSQCTPWNLHGCPVKLNVTNKDFVDATLVLYSGSVVVATRVESYSLAARNTVGALEHQTPDSGIFLANISAADRIVVGDSKVYGPTDGTIQRSRVVPVQTTQLSFAETFTAEELTSCHSYYVAVTSGRVLIASECRHALWRAMIDFGVEYILFLIIVVISLAIGLLCGVCSFLYIRRRCSRAKRARRALKQATVEDGQVPLSDVCSNKHDRVESDVDESAVQISVHNTSATYSKASSKTQKKKKATDDDDFWTRKTEHFKAGEPQPPPDPHASTNADAYESGFDSEEEEYDMREEEESSDPKKHLTLFQSIRLLDFVKRAVADHVAEPFNFKNVTQCQWSVIEGALMGLYLEESVSPHYTGAFKKLVKKRPPRHFVTWADYYKKKYQISLKHADMPMVEFGKHTPFPIPMELLTICDRRAAIDHSFDVVQCKLNKN
ncbi:hypothetical protein AAVH_13828 [Aphelenchoides avenae]|nr:hypothetical protein AAVH_13828 [Aphelenchus avenae]